MLGCGAVAAGGSTERRGPEPVPLLSPCSGELCLLPPIFSSSPVGLCVSEWTWLQQHLPLPPQLVPLQSHEGLEAGAAARSPALSTP